MKWALAVLVAIASGGVSGGAFWLLSGWLARRAERLAHDEEPTQKIRRPELLS